MYALCLLRFPLFNVRVLLFKSDMEIAGHQSCLCFVWCGTEDW